MKGREQGHLAMPLVLVFTRSKFLFLLKAEWLHLMMQNFE